MALVKLPPEFLVLLAESLHNIEDFKKCLISMSDLTSLIIKVHAFRLYFRLSTHTLRFNYNHANHPAPLI
jgi:hypothetical protein